MIWADEHPEALQVLADPTIRVASGLDERLGWALPAGWVPIVNRLHVAVADLIGDYEVIRVGSKGGGLRYAIDRPAEIDDLDAWNTAGRLVVEATHQSWTVCDLCGEPGERSMIATRCERHRVTRGSSRRFTGPPGAVARPPGWAR